MTAMTRKPIPRDGNGFSVKEIVLQVWEEQRQEFDELRRLFRDGHEDHETRIRAVEDRIPTNLFNRLRSLERWRYTLAGGLVVVGIVAGYAADVAVRHFHI